MGKEKFKQTAEGTVERLLDGLTFEQTKFIIKAAYGEYVSDFIADSWGDMVPYTFDEWLEDLEENGGQEWQTPQ